MSKIHLDIHSDNEFLNEFFRENNLINNKNITDKFKEFLENKNIPEKIVSVSYSPLSQKYIDHYDNESFQGTMFYSNKKYDDLSH